MSINAMVAYARGTGSDGNFLAGYSIVLYFYYGFAQSQVVELLHNYFQVIGKIESQLF